MRYLRRLRGRALSSDALKRAAGLAKRHLDSLDEREVVGPASQVDIERRLGAAYRFESPLSLDAVLDDMARMLARGTIHGGHKAYFGPFHPSPTEASVAASTLLAAMNPQMATNEHGAAAVAMEKHLLAHLAKTLGLGVGLAGERGSGLDSGLHSRFTSGAQEANTEALLLALARAFPTYPEEGLRALDASPVLYASVEAHHGLEKAATSAGLGRASIRRVAVDSEHRLDLETLERELRRDKEAGHRPFLVVATAGTTSSGAIDPLNALADLALREGISLHVDAAFGGGLAFSPSRRFHLGGIARADSITWDAHKWLRAPLGVGMLFARGKREAASLFQTEASYLPRQDEELDPVHTQLGWSRPASGIPLFVSLAELGDAGFASHIDATCEAASRLRALLKERGFTLVSNSALPIVCFDHPLLRRDAHAFARFAAAMHKGRDFFAPPVRFADGKRALRACITSSRTDEETLRSFVASCERALSSL